MRRSVGLIALFALLTLFSEAKVSSTESLHDSSVLANGQAEWQSRRYLSGHRQGHRAGHLLGIQHRQSLVAKAKSQVAAKKRMQLTATQRMAQELQLALANSQQMQLEIATRSAQKDAFKLRKQLERMKKQTASIEARQHAEESSFSQMEVEAARRVRAAEQAGRQLSTQLEAESKDEIKISTELKEKTLQVRKLKAELLSASHDQDNLRSILGAEKKSLLEHKANSSRASAAAEAEDGMIRHDRQGLLEQISEIQADSSKLQKSKHDADKYVKGLEENTHFELASKLKEVEHQKDMHTKKVAVLLQNTKSIRASLDSMTMDAEAAAAQAASLKKTASNMVFRFHVATDEAHDLKAARDTSLSEDAKLKAENAVSTRKLAASRDQISSLRRSLVEAQNEAEAGEAKANHLEKRRAALAEKLQVALMSEEATKAKGQKELQATMLNAADKIRALEDEKDGLSGQLASEKALLQTANTESSHAKQAQQTEQTQELQAQRQVASLTDALEIAQRARDASKQHVMKLSRSVAVLRDERDSSASALAQRLAAFSATQEKAEQLESLVSKENNQYSSFSTLNSQLSSQVTILSGQAQRASTLSARIATLQAAVRKKDAKHAQLMRQIETLNDLKESEASDLETARNDSTTWGANAKDLGQQVADDKAELQASQKQRISAVQKAKEASAEQDKYFEANMNLQDQNKALSSQLAAVLAMSNHSSEDEQQLREHMDEVRDDEARDRRNSQAALADVQRELAQAREQASQAASMQSAMEGELSTDRLILSDQQRQRLGLPPAATAAKVAIASLAGTSSNAPTAIAPVLEAPKKAAPSTPAPLAGEPVRPDDDAEATLAAIDNPTPSPQPQASSALQRLAAYFATPIQN